MQILYPVHPNPNIVGLRMSCSVATPASGCVPRSTTSRLSLQ